MILLLPIAFFLGCVLHYKLTKTADFGSKIRLALAPTRVTGNRAFDAYRAETIQRLEHEGQDFRAFLDRLHLAKDKAEFDRFMSERQGAA